MVFVLTLGVFLSDCEDDPVIVANGSGSTPEGVKAVADANNEFALDLYSQFKGDGGNIFYSPYSISVALAMTSEGARDQTAEEMQSVLHFPADVSVRRPNFASIYNEINKRDKSYLLSTGNALWAQKDYNFLDDYMDVVLKYYGGNVTNLDFVGDAEGSRQMINSWIEEQTNDKIKDLIPAGVLGAYTRLVLTNAIYFKGTWVKQFEKEDTREEDFTIGGGETVKVDMMVLTGEEARFNYTETDEIQVLEMPYDGNELSMLVILPKGDTLDVVEDSLTAEKLDGWRDSLTTQNVRVYFPKFKFETKYFMVETLSAMGMPTAFTSNADFSGMDGTRNLFIQSVIHQAFVEVNEEGTEAAAATAIVMAMSAVSQDKVFRADHPFIFIIQQRETRNILFMGRVDNPGA